VIQSQDVFVLESRKETDTTMKYTHKQSISYSILETKAAFMGLLPELKGILVND